MVPEVDLPFKMVYHTPMWLITFLLPLWMASTGSEVLLSTVEMEKAFLQQDFERYDNLYQKWQLELGRYRDMQESFSQRLQEEKLSPEELEDMALDVHAQWNYLMTLKDALAEVENRILERKKRIDNLLVEIKRMQKQEEEEDPITGKWEIVINPGEQKGEFRLKLSGVIVSGEYTLEGGWKGSLRGTLVGSSLRLERIDSEKGFMAVFYGRLVEDEKEKGKVYIKGTWESTQFGLGLPQTGTWIARRKP